MIMLLSIISVIAFTCFKLVAATKPQIGPIVFNSTDWSKYGYPILDRPIEYPYVIELFNGSRAILYESGPSDINEGDVLLIQTNGAQYKINNEWYVVGAVGPDGKYFKISDEYIKAAGIDSDDVVSHKSFQDVEVIINEMEKEAGQVLASDLDILSYYEEILRRKQKMLNDDRTQVLPKGSIENVKRHGVVCQNNNRCARASRCTFTADSGPGVWYCTCPAGFCVTAGGYVCNGVC